MNNCAIYKVCDPLGACLYVGSTVNPRNREIAHKKRFPNGVFTVIETVPSSRKNKAERTAILKFRNEGHAIENQVLPNDGKLIGKIKRLKVGRSLYLETESERTQALNIAKILGLRIATRARDNKHGGFTVTRLPE